MRAWHFLYEGNKMRNGKVAPADGVPLVFNDKPILCRQGLHASVDAFDALQHAPGPILCLVECSGKIIKGNDKIVCTERTIIARMDATELLLYYARMQALSVVHKWDAPDVVFDYLMTGNKSIRSAARSAAESAASWSAAKLVALSAAESAAESAARSAARSAVWSAAESAVLSAAKLAANWAARSAANSAARKEFNDLVNEAFADYL